MAQTRQTLKDDLSKEQVARGVSWQATSNGHRDQASTMLGRKPHQGVDHQVTTVSVFVARVHPWVLKDSLVALERCLTDHSSPASARVTHTYEDPHLTIL
jgi:hypothetical protein